MGHLDHGKLHIPATSRTLDFVTRIVGVDVTFTIATVSVEPASVGDKLLVENPFDQARVNYSNDRVVYRHNRSPPFSVVWGASVLL